MNIEKLAEQKYPYEFMVEKRIVDARRKGFIEGLEHKQKATKKFKDITPQHACEVAKILHGDKYMFVSFNGVVKDDKTAYMLEGMRNTTTWISFFDDKSIEIVVCELQKDSQIMDLDTQLVYKAYSFLKEQGYEVE